MEKPKVRSKLRLFLGKCFFTCKRYVYWYFSNTEFAQELKTEYLPEEIFSHQTVLLRKLKGADMKLQHNKITNLKIAIKNLDGLIIEPGQTFSYWRQIGEPSKQKGYLSGMVLRDGRVLEGTGGGLCQLSNLIYWMTLHTPLKVIERWRHTYDVFPDSRRSQPFGSGATCGYPNIDLQIKNTTNQLFQLQLNLTDTHLVGRWLSEQVIDFEYKVLEKGHQIKQEWWGGYTRNNEIYRLCTNKLTNSTHEEFVTKNHAVMMYTPLLEKANH